MKNLKNRIEVIEEDLQKKEIKRQQEQKVRKVDTEAKNIKIERLPYSYSALKQLKLIDSKDSIKDFVIIIIIIIKN